jgi:serine/threonine-protein kinase
MHVERFGKYLLLEKLASGGMAEVFLAKIMAHTGISKFIAIKRILPQFSENPQFNDMFREEAKIAVNLNHSNIVSIYDFGFENNQLFLVMEFVEGQNLRQVLNHLKKEGKELSLDQIVYIIKEVAAGLDHAHRCLDGASGKPLNITHRDMSPQNVMVSFEGEIKIVDFGIAKAETQLEQTQAGTIKGKFGYMSPEQAEGLAVDPRTDIFSLGIILWEMIAKDRLFLGHNEAATIKKVKDCVIPSLRKLNLDVPAELERICLKALAKDRALRYQTAAAMSRDLNVFLNKHYPEFSAQDFSRFMKSAYHRMYIENRKKLAEYAKINPPPDSMSKQQEEVTHAIQKEDDLPFGSSALNLPQAQSVDVAKLRSHDAPPTNKSVIVQKPKGFETHPGYRLENTKRSPARTEKISGSSNFLPHAIIIALLGAGLWLLGTELKLLAINFLDGSNQIKKTSRLEPIRGATELALSQPISLNIQSNPQGATVEINGRAVGITPYVGSVPEGEKFNVRLTRDGFIPRELIDQVAIKNPQGEAIMRLNITLQPQPPSGFVEVLLVGPWGTDTFVLINGQRVIDRAQLARYPVPAGVPVRIEAKSPFMKAEASQVIEVNRDQLISVKLPFQTSKTSGSSH